MLCAAYVLPGLVGRDPWRNADLNAFGLMLAMAEGRTSWWAPALGGVLADTALPPHWLGAVFIALGQGWLDPALAARVPFALLLALTTFLGLFWMTMGGAGTLVALLNPTLRSLNRFTAFEYGASVLMLTALLDRVISRRSLEPWRAAGDSP